MTWAGTTRAPGPGPGPGRPAAHPGGDAAPALGAARGRGSQRSWPPLYRGPLAIHAGKRQTAEGRGLCEDDDCSDLLRQAGYRRWQDLPFGAVVAVVTLPAYYQTERMPDIGGLELLYGDFSPGRWAWQLTDVHRLADPVPARGYQRLWRWWGGTP